MADIQELFKAAIVKSMDTGLDIDLNEGLGHNRYDHKYTDNSRRGYSSETLKTCFGKVDINIFRDRKDELDHVIL